MDLGTNNRKPSQVTEYEYLKNTKLVKKWNSKNFKFIPEPFFLPFLHLKKQNIRCRIQGEPQLNSTPQLLYTKRPYPPWKTM